MNQLYFAKSSNGTVFPGTILHTEPQDERQAAIIVKDSDTLTADGNTYLLTPKDALQFVSQIPTREGVRLNFQMQKSAVALAYDENYNLVEASTQWIKPGAMTNRGTVIECSDNIAVCKAQGQVKTYFKKSLLPAVARIDELKAETAAIEYGATLRKSLAAQAPKPAATVQQPPKLKVSFKGPRASIVPTQEHTEGETRSFGNNDMRKLVRTPSGKMRWMNADEEAKMKAEAAKTAGDEVHAKERAKYNDGTKQPGIMQKLFRIGKELFVGGQRATVKDYADDIIAVQKEDGTTATVRASEYNAEHHTPTTVPVKKPEGTPEETAQKELARRAEQTALQTDVHGQTPKNKYYSEVQKIEAEQMDTEEYRAFEKMNIAEGWTPGLGSRFRYIKDSVHITPDGIEYHGTMERIYRPDKKDYDFYFDNEGFDVSYGGKQMRVKGITGSTYKLQGEDGKEIDIENTDLDEYRGMITLDSEGNASVKNMKGEEKGQMDLDEGITQADLFREGTIKIIRHEVWKSVRNAEGAVIEDYRLGKIRGGIVYYKHGNTVAIVDDDLRQVTTDEAGTRRDIPQLSTRQKQVRREVKKERERLDARKQARQDVETVKARELQAKVKIPYADKGKGFDASNYTDVMDKWMKDGGTGMSDQLADSFTNPAEWDSNVRALAERMRVEDVNRAVEVASLNDFAKSGVMITPEEPKPIDAYLDTAKKMLSSKRDEIMRRRRMERREKERMGEVSEGAFGKDEAAELPAEDSGAVVSDNVQTIRDSRNDSYQVQYAFVPKQSVIASHSIEGTSNPDHPAELQARERGNDYASNLQMKQIAENPNEELVADNKDATRGAPVAYSKYGKIYIVQGNGRTGAVLGMQGKGEEKYFGMMLQKAEELGKPKDKITKDMMLVRLMSPVHTYSDARKLGAFGQASSALPLTEIEAARGVQNAGGAFDFESLNLDGIGRRAITEKNIGSFIRNNPELYRQMAQQSGFNPDVIADRPAEQAKVVNTALLSQLDTDFIRSVSKRGESTHELVKSLAPIITQNKKDVKAGIVPEEGNIQSIIKNTIEQYDTLPSNLKNKLKVDDKNGTIPFLDTSDAALQDPDSLISRMRQEAIQFGDKEGNIFRNPVNVISMIAYHQAMTPRDPDRKDQAREAYALKVKRFGDALKALKDRDNQGLDLLTSMMPEEDQKSQRADDIIKIAERVFLENKPYAPEPEGALSNEEREAAADIRKEFNVHKTMKQIAKQYGFGLESSKAKMKKSLFGRTIVTPLERDRAEFIEFQKSQLGLFDKPEPHVGDTKTEGGQQYQLQETTQGAPRWHKIKRIISVKDTREYELDENDHAHPIPGSGTDHECDRCGKNHQIHAIVELENGDLKCVGTGCMTADEKAASSTLRTVTEIQKDLKAATLRLEKYQKKLDAAKKNDDEVYRKTEEASAKAKNATSIEDIDPMAIIGAGTLTPMREMDELRYRVSDAKREVEKLETKLANAMERQGEPKPKTKKQIKEEFEAKLKAEEDERTRKDEKEMLLARASKDMNEANMKFWKPYSTWMNRPKPEETMFYINDAGEHIRVLKGNKMQEEILAEMGYKPKQIEPMPEIKKSFFARVLTLFKSQLDLFKPMQAKTPTNFNAGVPGWKKSGQEKPGHKYIRRQRGANGEWEYIYKDAQGKEYKGEAKTGKKLPKHFDWKEGDTVLKDGKSYRLVASGTTIATIQDEAGNKMTARIADLKHEAEHQKELAENTPLKRWERILKAHEDDLKQGQHSGKFQYAGTRLELERKIKGAKEELAKWQPGGEKAEARKKGEAPKQDENPEQTGKNWDITKHEQNGKIQMIAKAEGSEIGEIAIAPRADGNYEVTNALVWPKHQRKGNGTELYRIASEEAKAHGKKLFISSDPSDDAKALHVSMKKAGMLMDNGEVSFNDTMNATPVPQTETPAFKKWFGDSKVVDKDGKPLKVFHGTTQDFKQFKEGWNYFSDNAEYSNRFTGYSEEDAGNVKAAYISMQNPIDMRELGTRSSDKKIIELLKGYGIQADQSWMSKRGTEDTFFLINNETARKELTKAAEDAGYDGIILNDVHAGDYNDLISGRNPKRIAATSYITFKPTQIKSAIGNEGTFDPSNPDITKSVAADIAKARKDTDTNPTEAQKHAGNYAKGTVTVHGLEIALENPKGSYRSGIDPNGTEWKTKLAADYGYFKEADPITRQQIKGKDKDAVDVFLGTHASSDTVWVINQIDPDTMKLDEHKILFLFDSYQEATETYKACYDDDAEKRIGSVVEMDIDEFKLWLKYGNKQIPAYIPAQ